MPPSIRPILAQQSHTPGGRAVGAAGAAFGAPAAPPIAVNANPVPREDAQAVEDWENEGGSVR
jgi:hypothetical protein